MERMRQLATPGSPRPPRRMDAVGLAVAGVAVAVTVAVAVSVVSLIDRYVGWAPVGIAVGGLSLLCVVVFVTLGLADRLRRER
jgi:predicted MFS family arabinose efflux permease